MRRPQWIPARSDLAGIALAMFVGVAALGIARALPPSPFVSDILLAVLLGALVLNTPLRHLVGLAIPSGEREPDRYANGLRFTGKWILRLGIILMGLKVQTSIFKSGDLVLVASVALVTIPSAFFVAHAIGGALGVRRPMVDILAGGTMICGASAVNAIAPVAVAKREEQGVAIGVVFLFSVVALVAFRPIAAAIGIDSSFAGLWSGLAVNDLSSAIAVGAQMGGAGMMMAAASKSARILLLAPTLVALSILRRGGGPLDKKKQSSLRATIVDALPMFILGYVALAIVRAAGDRFLGDAAPWQLAIAADKWLVDLTMLTVSAGIGLHLSIKTLLASSTRAAVVGGGASVWMAAVSCAMIAFFARGSTATAALVGGASLVLSFVAYRAGTGRATEEKNLQSRFASGAPLSLREARRLLDVLEREAAMDDAHLKQVLAQLHPTIGELIPVRESPLSKGEGCRWLTYWEGASGWALVAVCREPGSFTPIHAHPHRLLGKAIEGVLEELRFAEKDVGIVEVSSRAVLGHDAIVETDGLATLHVVRVVGDRPAIDLQLRGPEVGKPGRRLRTTDAIDFGALAVGARVAATEEADDRPGHGGEGAKAGRVPGLSIAAH
jgi:uncharacterized membrane protein YadS